MFEDVRKSILFDRIKRLGEHYVFWNYHWLVKTELSAEEIYKELRFNNFDTNNIFITQMADDYFGLMNIELWEFLKESSRK